MIGFGESVIGMEASSIVLKVDALFLGVAIVLEELDLLGVLGVLVGEVFNFFEGCWGAKAEN
jgi:hypothetical protein